MSAGGRLLAAAAETAWLAGFADRAIGLLDEARSLSENNELLIQIDSLSGHIATRRGPVARGYTILVTAAERIAATCPNSRWIYSQTPWTRVSMAATLRECC